MSIDDAIRRRVRAEVTRALAPLSQALTRLAMRLERLERARPVPPAQESPTPLPAQQAGQGCAVIGCPRVPRSLGYCSAHYQRLRFLARRGNLPADWKPGAAPGTVRELRLPRGRVRGAPSPRAQALGKPRKTR